VIYSEYSDLETNGINDLNKRVKTLNISALERLMEGDKGGHSSGSGLDLHYSC